MQETDLQYYRRRAAEEEEVAAQRSASLEALAAYEALAQPCRQRADQLAVVG